MSRKFTGRHMLAITIAFFSVVIGVNVFMATAATRTFGGTVVDNSYVASQEFNKWLAEARAQKRHGWKVATRVESGRVEVTMTSTEGALRDAHIEGIAAHPLGRAADVALTFAERSPGVYVASARLPAGRWRLKLHAARGIAVSSFVADVAA